MFSQHNCGEVKGRLTIGRSATLMPLGNPVLAHFTSFAAPRAPGGMTDMNKPCFASLYRPVNQKRISASWKHSCFPNLNSASPFRKLTDQLNGPADCTMHIACT